MSSFNQIPKAAKVQPKEFTVAIPEQDLQEFYQLLQLSKIGPDTYEGRQGADKYGVTRDWLVKTKAEWEKWSWRDFEKKLNSYNHYIVPVTSGSDTLDIHFVGLFSTNPSAIPIVFNHGWPGSFLEFLGIIDLLSSRYTPETLPYHVVVPSLPGYAFSSKPPLDREFTIANAAALLNELMINLGFGSGYVTQGGDIGSYTSRILAVKHEACKAVHLNFCLMKEPDNLVSKNYTQSEQVGLERLKNFREFGSAYANEHGTRPATIGLALSASPLALAAWIGEKFLIWVDEPLPLNTILESLSLYWLTQTFPTAIYNYRIDSLPQAECRQGNPDFVISKPFGFSRFPKELGHVPKSWIETGSASGKLDFFKEHTKGGHFAALEKPEVLLGDVEEFIDQVWKK